MDELVKSFLAQFGSVHTRDVYGSDIRAFLNYIKKECSDYNRIDIVNYIVHVRDEKKSAPRTIKRVYNAIRSFTRFLNSVNVNQENLSGFKFKLPTINPTKKRAMTDEDVSMFLSTFNERYKIHSRDKAITYLMLYNGLRRNEVCDLKISSIKKIENGYTLEILGKGGKIRVKPLHPRAIEAIKKYLKTFNRISDNADQPLFKTEDNKHKMDGDLIWFMVSHHCKKAGIEGISPHSFRAKFASLALESGVPITSVQDDMGHSKIDTTAMYDRSRTALERSSVLLLRTIDEKGDPEG